LEVEDRQPVALAARLPQTGTIAPTTQSIGSSAKGRLDRRRLFRVLDYIDCHLEGDLTLDSMASIACLSRFHFARAFRQAVGQSPRRYVIARRLERAKVLLIEDDAPLVEIALALRFSSQLYSRIQAVNGPSTRPISSRGDGGARRECAAREERFQGNRTGAHRSRQGFR
jgi:AraC-like DNA-binding protein